MASGESTITLDEYPDVFQTHLFSVRDDDFTDTDFDSSAGDDQGSSFQYSQTSSDGTTTENIGGFTSVPLCHFPRQVVIDQASIKANTTTSAPSNEHFFLVYVVDGDDFANSANWVQVTEPVVIGNGSAADVDVLNAGEFTPIETANIIPKNATLVLVGDAEDTLVTDATVAVTTRTRLA